METTKPLRQCLPREREKKKGATEKWEYIGRQMDRNDYINVYVSYGRVIEYTKIYTEYGGWHKFE